MGTAEQLVTIAAVLLGALTTHLTTYAMERSRNRHALLTRWDDRKIDAYGGYVDRVRASIFLAVQLYEHKEGIRRSEKPEDEMLAELLEAGRLRGRAFERVMLLGGDDVVEAAHQLNVVALEVDWQAEGKVSGTLEDWRARSRAVFREVNEFHEAARVDLGVQGSVKGEKHPERDLLLPSARRDEDTTA
ncbi:hypothetical protein J7I98_14605 [Streptomyces sp. ISL-98]|uniref:hypothetical protein n=1 Tax=Streptomyces sp. ISL-98 TaxID=2819192 RepID=UPI001BED13A7|nr:hypothetical protein [Streptomyces sp. ISL-98]MBT2507096.1 hypothetical protein [Streptomyces sp. ISL-98]